MNDFVLPFYIVVDTSESDSSAGKAGIIDAQLSTIHSAIASDPLVSDKCRICVVAFSDAVEILLPMMELTELTNVPGVQIRGSRLFEPVFNFLKPVIASDIVHFRSTGDQVYRPAVFFMTDGEPMDAEIWELSYRGLVDRTVNRYWPWVIAFGLPGSSAETVGKIGSLAGFMSSDQVTGGGVIEEVIRFLSTDD